MEKDNKEEKTAVKAYDPYMIDLLEDILTTVKNLREDNEKTFSAIFEGLLRILMSIVELQSMVARGFAITMKSDSEGYLSRTNKLRAHDLKVFAKEFSEASNHYNKLLDDLERAQTIAKDGSEDELMKHCDLLVKDIMKPKEESK